MVTVPDRVVMDDASDALLFVTLDPIVVTRPANDDDSVVAVLSVVVTDAAKDELAVLMLDCSPSILVAADELLLDTVPLNVVIEEFNEADVV